MASTNVDTNLTATLNAAKTLSEKTPAASVQPVASKTSSAPTPAASFQPVNSKAPPHSKPAATRNVLPGYEVIRVKKPDGTIIKVQRPIQEPAAPGASNVPAKGLQTTSAAAQTSQKTTSAPSTTPATQASNASPAAQNPTKGEAPSEKPKTSSITPPAPAGSIAQPSSKRAAAISSYSIFNRLRRIRRRGAQIAQVFDPSGDYAIFEDGDIPMDSDGDDGFGDDDDDDDNDDNGVDTERPSDSPRSGQVRTPEHQAGVPGNIQLPNGAVPQPATRGTTQGTPPAPTTKKGQLQVSEKETKPHPTVEGEKPLPPRTRTLSPYGAHWTRWIIWAITLILPLLFIALGILASRLGGKNENGKYGRAVTQATKAAISTWPILFAAVIAQSLKALATYKVERGIRVMTLEQLIGSHSVASAIKQPFLLRKPDLLTVGLTALWALSPLASQAMQRWASLGPSNGHDNFTISYLDTSQVSYGLELVNYTSNRTQWNNADNFLAPMDELFMASFLHQNNSGSSSDPWANILIPEYPKSSSTAPPPTDWVDVTQPVYLSFYGIPVVYNNYTDSTDIGIYHSYMKSSYLQFNCPSITVTTLQDLGDRINLAGSNTTDAGDENDPFAIYLDPLQTKAGATRLWPSDGLTLWLGMTHPDGNQNRNFTFLSQNTQKGVSPASWDEISTVDFSYALCTLREVFVESHVECDTKYYSNPCTVKAMREIPLNSTDYSMLPVNLVRASGIGGNDLTFSRETLMERYINDPTSITSVQNVTNNLSKVPLDLFTMRLSQLVNTFYVSSFAPGNETELLNKDIFVDVYDGDSKMNMSLMAHTTANIVYDDWADRQYIVDFRWIGVFEFCAVVLLVFGVANVLWESRSLAPDILGFASSVARHSRNVKLPPTESNMTGAERARKMANQRVMFQDAWPERPVGKIVLGPAFDGAEKLKEGRLYR